MVRAKVISIAIPDPLRSDKEYGQFYGYDLPYIETRDLLCELCSIRCQLWVLKSSDRWTQRLGRFECGRRIAWLEERVSRIENELKGRRYASEIKRQTKPRLAQGVRL
jgi:hypothetical protein